MWLCGAEAGEVLRCALDMQQGLVKELKEQTHILAQEKERLERRCLQQNQQIEKLQQELSQPHTERGNSTGASSLHPHSRPHMHTEGLSNIKLPTVPQNLPIYTVREKVQKLSHR